jgi:hypothetical protein
MYINRYSCQTFMNLEFSRHFCEILSNVKFHENPSSGNRAVSCREADKMTERHDEVKSRSSQFWERA